MKIKIKIEFSYNIQININVLLVIPGTKDCDTQVLLLNHPHIPTNKCN